MKKVLTVKQTVVEYFCETISYWMLLELVKAGKIPHFRVGNKILFRTETLDEWMDLQEKEKMNHQENDKQEDKLQDKNIKEYAQKPSAKIRRVQA